MTNPSISQGRLLILAAAVLWSFSGAFVKILTRPTVFDLGDPPVHGLTIAFYRPLFAGMLLLPFLRPRQITFRPLILGMALCFAAMNALFVSALAMGSAANAIILQYTAPLWLALAAYLVLKESLGGRQLVALGIAMAGLLVILVGALQQPSPEALLAVLVALGSGLTYAGVLFFLSLLRDAAPAWLTILNHLTAALLLAPVLWWVDLPTLPQLGFLVFFGIVQMGLPYVLMARGLKVVSAQEAGTLSLLEPVLNPLWAYLVAGDLPESAATYVGGGLILAALVYRYAPLPRRDAGP